MAEKKKAPKRAPKKRTTAPAKPVAKKRPTTRRTAASKLSSNAALKELLGPTSAKALAKLASALVSADKNTLSLNEDAARAMASALFSDASEAEAYVGLLRKVVKETQARASATSVAAALP